VQAALQAQLDEANTERRRLEETLQTHLDEANTERRRLEETLQAHLGDANRLETALRAELEAATGEHSRVQAALQAQLDEADNLGAALRTVLDVAAEEHRRVETALRMQLDETNGECRRLTAALEASEDRAEKQAADAGSASDQSVKTAADQLVVLQALTEQVRRLSPLAAAGRAAREISSELQDLVKGADAVATRVLAETPLDHPTRGDVESFRADAIQAAALADELFSACADTDEAGPAARCAGRGRRRV
jgi:DNA repair exonuclease SbcCD ATPase subunit